MSFCSDVAGPVDNIAQDEPKRCVLLHEKRFATKGKQSADLRSARAFQRKKSALGDPEGTGLERRQREEVVFDGERQAQGMGERLRARVLV